MHWGLYSVPAFASEWYSKHMYATKSVMEHHVQTYGRQDSFGYKDFIPMFKAEKFDPDDWAELFVKAGAKYVIPTAEHHDGFALYDSDLTIWCAGKMGPKRDLIGDLAKAVRARGMKFGVSNHRMEHWSFMYPAEGTPTDQFDPRYADFYGPPQPPRTEESQAFLEEWLRRCQELVDKYQPDMIFFDNGINGGKYDSVKLRFAAYYYNASEKWGKQVSITTKSDAYLAGTIQDFERQGRALKEWREATWQVDDPIGDKFGYVEGMGLKSAPGIVRNLVENISKNGNLMLNISPKADGTIPEAQRKILLDIGAWLKINGEGVYGSRSMKLFGEGKGETMPVKNQGGEFRFTRKGNTLYCFALSWPGTEAVLYSLGTATAKGKVTRITLLGYDKPLNYTQSAESLKIEIPETAKTNYASTFRIEGLNLN